MLVVSFSPLHWASKNCANSSNNQLCICILRRVMAVLRQEYNSGPNVRYYATWAQDNGGKARGNEGQRDPQKIDRDHFLIAYRHRQDPTKLRLVGESLTREHAERTSESEIPPPKNYK